MNVHHLELFYYVVRHGGISRAVRHMPYGIQQPAVSGQILQLERDLGLKLFERSPFRLTATGEQLFAFIRPFFENLGAVGARLRATPVPELRIGASEPVLRDHLPAVLQGVRQGYPKLRLDLRSGYQAQLEAWLQERQIDLAVTALERRPAARLRCLPLVSLPLVLLVPRRSKIRSVADLWAKKFIDEPLISLPPTESVSRHFQQELKRRHIGWPPGIVASSIELVTRYVADGAGLGVSVDMPEAVRHRRVRVLPLTGFKPVEVVALLTGRPSPLVQKVLDEMLAYAQRRWPATEAA